MVWTKFCCKDMIKRDMTNFNLSTDNWESAAEDRGRWIKDLQAGTKHHHSLWFKILEAKHQHHTMVNSYSNTIPNPMARDLWKLWEGLPVKDRPTQPQQEMQVQMKRPLSK